MELKQDENSIDQTVSQDQLERGLPQSSIKPYLSNFEDD
jgi:hypothetical protein